MISRLGKIGRNFSTIQDPYYVLGIDKNTQFADIKKAYYKLAAQYHPDINKANNAERQFLQIKESFEQIKVMRGEAVAMGNENNQKHHHDYQSVRKNYKDYDENWDHKKEQESDYQEFIHKSTGLEGQEYDNMRKSFKTIHDIKDLKFKPISMKMPDPSKRFHLGQVMFLKALSDGSNLYIIIVGFGMLLAFIIINGAFVRTTVTKNENLIYGMLNQQIIKTELDEDELLERVEYKLKHNLEYKQFKRQLEATNKVAEDNRRNYVPIIQNFVSQEDMQDTIL